MSLLDHQELSIVKGVGPTPSDTLSAEQPLTIVDLLTTGSAFGLVEWTPNIPSLKSGGVWADSSITDGRTLIAAVNTNVIETIVVQLTGSTIADFASQFAKFQRMIQDSRDDWDTFYQIEPVYLRWWANNAPGPQFALIYNIDMDVEWDDSNLAQAKLTLKIEREVGWRGVRPGGNPKEWTAYVHRVPFNAAYADLSNQTNTDHLASVLTANNKQELTTFNTFLTTNFMTIPATSIPGDLPALTLLSLGATGNGASYYVARDTRPLNLSDTVNGVSQLRKLNVFGAEGSLGTNAAFVNDAGGMQITSVSANRRRVDVTYATPGDTKRWSFKADMTLMRGMYMVFARIRQYAGAQNDLKYYLKVTSATDTFFQSDTNKFPILSGTVAASSTNPLDYLGILSIPSYNKSASQMRGGSGLMVSDENSSAGSRTNFVTFELWSSRVAGVAANLAFYDFVLLPIDEFAAKCDAVNGVGTAVFDNTGYLNHGNPDAVVQKRQYGGSADQIDNIELAGNLIMLAPGRTNYIYWLNYTDTGTAVTSPSSGPFDVLLDIVPRWSGIRDV